jgi:hypothetical protein
MHSRFVAWILLGGLAACSDRPLLRPYTLEPTPSPGQSAAGTAGGAASYSVGSQRLLASARHWNAMAFDIAAAVKTKSDAAPGKCVAITWKTPHNVNPTKFEQLLRDSLVTRLINLPPDAGKIQVYESAYGGANGPCDSVEIESEFVQLHASDAKFPGTFTTLSTGLVVVRDVVRNFSEGRFIALGLGIDALNYFTRPNAFGVPYAELAVTVSRKDANTQYLWRYTDVYYVSAADKGLYEHDPPPHLVPPDAAPPVAAHREFRRSPYFDVHISGPVDPCAKTAVIDITARALTTNPENYFLGGKASTGIEAQGSGVMSGMPGHVKATFSDLSLAGNDTAMLEVNLPDGWGKRGVALAHNAAGKCPAAKSDGDQKSAVKKPAGPLPPQIKLDPATVDICSAAPLVFSMQAPKEDDLKTLDSVTMVVPDKGIKAPAADFKTTPGKVSFGNLPPMTPQSFAWISQSVTSMSVSFGFKGVKGKSSTRVALRCGAAGVAQQTPPAAPTPTPGAVNPAPAEPAVPPKSPDKK